MTTTQNSAIVNELDKRRLAPHLETSADYPPVHRLRAFLEEARAVPPALVPPDIVTMNSCVVIRDPRDDSIERYILAYPSSDGDGYPRAHPNGHGGEPLTVISPLGSVLLGASEGSRVTVMGPRGPRSVSIDSIEYQPERAGHYDL